MTEPLSEVLIKKISARSAAVGIIGLGYVGLPLVREFLRAGFPVAGFDIDERKVALLKEGKSYIKHIDASLFHTHAGRFTATADFGGLSPMDCIIVCVPTPLNKNREPDMSYVFSTTQAIARSLRKGQLVVLESTTYPGTTDEDMRAILEETGLRAGEDFFLAYSPEREDPNNSQYTTRTIAKVIGGYTPACLECANTLYTAVVEQTVSVSSTRVAEAAKLLENIYRSVNIALVNELKVLFDRMDIDIWEVIEAAKTKPFGFHPFYPGPGLGGHCIPIDPFYLTWKAREYDVPTRFIELAGEINTLMPYYVVQKTVEALNEKGISIKGARLLLLGLAYKKNVDDLRESPSLKLMELFMKQGAEVDYNDPYIPATHKMRKYDFRKSSVPLTPQALEGYDCVIIATDHTDYDPGQILAHARLIVDTRNVIKDPGSYRGKVIKA